MADPITLGTALATVVDGGQKAIKIAQGLIFLRDRFDKYQQKKAEEWWGRIVEQFQGRTAHETEAEVEAKLHDLAERDYILRALNQSWRSVMDSLDDAVLPVLASLTAEYLAEDKRPDAYFRGMCRILADLSYEEFSSLQTLMEWAAAYKGKTDLLRIGNNMSFTGPGGQNITDNGVRIGDFPPNGTTQDSRLDTPLRHFRRLAHLFQTNGYEANRGMEGNADAIYLEKSSVRRIHDLVNVTIQKSAG